MRRASDSEPQRSNRSDVARNRSSILEAAREGFAEGGRQVEIRQIAARARVGVGTVYRHFPSRDDLVRTLVDLASQEGRALLEEAVREEDPSAAVRRMCRAVAQVYRRFGAIGEVAFGGHPHGYAPYAREGDRLVASDMVRSVMERGMREGAFRRDLDMDLAVMAAIRLCSREVFTALGPNRSFEEVADLVAEFMLAAMR